MAQDENNATDPREWLPMGLPATLAIVEGPNVNISAGSGTLERDDEGSLVLRISGVGEGPTERSQGRAGSPIVGETVILETRSFHRVVVEGFYPVRWMSQHSERLRELESTVTGRVSRVSIAYLDQQPSRVVEWLHHAPHHVSWPHATERNHESKQVRVRGKESIELWTGPNRRRLSRDHVRLELNESFVSSVQFGIVDQKDAPACEGITRPGFLAFDAGPNGLPDEAQRYSIRSALGFLTGCGLGLVGVSEFSSNHRPIKIAMEYRSAAGGERDEMPALLHEQVQQFLDPILMERFVRAYVRHPDVETLNRVVWLLRHSLDATVDTSAVYSGVAFEILRKSYYDDPQRVRRTKKIDLEAWRPLKAELAAVIERAGLSLENAEALKQGLQHFNDVSGRKLNVQFLDDLGLDHDRAENAALAARNDAAHGKRFDALDARMWVACAAALRTLVNRTVFAFLGVEPYGYFDYGDFGNADGFFSRKLKDAQGIRYVSSGA